MDEERHHQMSGTDAGILFVIALGETRWLDGPLGIALSCASSVGITVYEEAVVEK